MKRKGTAMSYIFDIHHNAQEPAYRSIYFESDSNTYPMQYSRRRWADARQKHLTEPGDYWTLSDPDGIVYHSVFGRIREVE